MRMRMRIPSMQLQYDADVNKDDRMLDVEKNMKIQVKGKVGTPKIPGLLYRFLFHSLETHPLLFQQGGI